MSNVLTEEELSRVAPAVHDALFAQTGQRLNYVLVVVHPEGAQWTSAFSDAIPDQQVDIIAVEALRAIAQYIEDGRDASKFNRPTSERLN